MGMLLCEVYCCTKLHVSILLMRFLWLIAIIIPLCRVVNNSGNTILYNLSGFLTNRYILGRIQ